MSDGAKVVPIRRDEQSPLTVDACWTVPELAAYLRVSRRTITEWIRAGRLSAHRLSRTVTVISPQEVERFLRSHTTGRSDD